MDGIILGFQYNQKATGIAKLPSSLIDIYHIYNWMDSVGYSTNIFSDCLSTDNNIELIKSAINIKIADIKFLNFDFNLINYVSNKHQLIENLRKVLITKQESKKICIYYTGHGEDGSILLPNSEKIDLSELQEHIYSFFSEQTEFFWILDCCYPGNMNLPYKLEKNQFKFQGLASRFLTNPTLVLSSSETKEPSVATKYGSLFTRFLANDLSNMSRPIIKNKNKYNRNLRRICSRLITEIRKIHVEYSQTVSVYSSYLFDPILWFWITGFDDIVFDYESIAFVLRT